MEKETPKLIWRYGVALGMVALALMLELLVWPLVQPTITPLFFLSVIASAWYGGLGPGLLTTVLSALVIAHYFIPPFDSLVMGWADFFRLSVFTVTALVINALTSARKHAEEALKHQQHLLRVTLSSIGDGIIATDNAAAVTFMNPVAEELTGWTAQEAQGRNIGEVFSLIHEQTRQAVENPAERALREGVAVGLANHTSLISRANQEIPIAESGAPIRDHMGQQYGAVLIFQDITARRQTEEVLLKAKQAAETADRAKSEFLATMSHELRNPLAVIMGYADMLAEGAFGAPHGEQLDIFARVKRNAQNLYDLILAMLDLSRLEAGRLPIDAKTVHIPTLIEEVRTETQEVCDRSGLHVVWHVQPALAPLQTDPGKLKIVVKNLIGNAVKFTREGSITVRAHEQEGGIEIRVSDTGIGIPSDALALIFEPFRQVDWSPTHHPGGTGLGLHIVQRLLELMGGKVTVESVVGCGSTFRVWLPQRRNTTNLLSVDGDRKEAFSE